MPALPGERLRRLEHEHQPGGHRGVRPAGRRGLRRVGERVRSGLRKRGLRQRQGRQRRRQGGLQRRDVRCGRVLRSVRGDADLRDGRRRLRSEQQRWWQGGLRARVERGPGERDRVVDGSERKRVDGGDHARSGVGPTHDRGALEHARGGAPLPLRPDGRRHQGHVRGVPRSEERHGLCGGRLGRGVVDGCEHGRADREVGTFGVVRWRRPGRGGLLLRHAGRDSEREPGRVLRRRAGGLGSGRRRSVRAPRRGVRPLRGRGRRHLWQPGCGGVLRVDVRGGRPRLPGQRRGDKAGHRRGLRYAGRPELQRLPRSGRRVVLGVRRWQGDGGRDLRPAGLGLWRGLSPGGGRGAHHRGAPAHHRGSRRPVVRAVQRFERGGGSGEPRARDPPEERRLDELY